MVQEEKEIVLGQKNEVQEQNNMVQEKEIVLEQKMKMVLEWKR